MKRASLIAKTFFWLLLIATVCICFGCQKEVEYVPVSQRPIPAGYMSDKENQMILLTNQYRNASGLNEFKTSLHLYHLAKARVYDMAERDTLSHYGFYPAYIESGALFYGESISSNYITAQSNIEGFRASEEHWKMFMSVIYEYVAVACKDNYTVVLAARWRPYRADGKKQLQIKEVRLVNISKIELE